MPGTIATPYQVKGIPQLTQDFIPAYPFLEEWTQQLKPTMILEAGTGYGDATRLLATLIQPYRGRLTTIDTQLPQCPLDWFQAYPNVTVIRATRSDWIWATPVHLLMVNSHLTEENPMVACSTLLFRLWACVTSPGLILVHGVRHQETGSKLQAMLQSFALHQRAKFYLYPTPMGLGALEKGVIVRTSS